MMINDVLSKVKKALYQGLSLPAMVGLGGLGVLVWLVLWFEITQTLEEKNKAILLMASEVDLRQQIQVDPKWAERANASFAALEGLEARFWQARTEGLAAARIQTELNILLKQAGLSNPTIQVQIPPLNVDRAKVFEINLNAADNGAGMIRFLALLERTEGLIVVKDLTWYRASQRLNLVLAAPAIITELTPSDPVNGGNT